MAGDLQPLPVSPLDQPLTNGCSPTHPPTHQAHHKHRSRGEALGGSALAPCLPSLGRV